MVTVLVANTGTLDIEFDVNAVSFCINIEEFASDVDGSREGVLSVVDTLRPCQSAGGEFTCKVFSSISTGGCYKRQGRTNPGRSSPRGRTPTH